MNAQSSVISVIIKCNNLNNQRPPNLCVVRKLAALKKTDGLEVFFVVWQGVITHDGDYPRRTSPSQGRTVSENVWKNARLKYYKCQIIRFLVYCRLWANLDVNIQTVANSRPTVISRMK